MRTVEDKLKDVVDAKVSIRNKIQEMGVVVGTDVLFKDYPDYIAMLVDIPETTDDQDLLQMCDVVEYIGLDKYENKTYTNEEIQDLENYLDMILTKGDLVNE